MEGPQPVKCIRCDVPLVFAGPKLFYIWPKTRPLFPLSSDVMDVLRLEHCVCPECGHVEFFAPGVGDRSLNPPAADTAPLSGIGPLTTLVASNEGGMEETWMCPCGECNYARYDKCLGCGAPRPGMVEG